MNELTTRFGERTIQSRQWQLASLERHPYTVDAASTSVEHIHIESSRRPISYVSALAHKAPPLQSEADTRSHLTIS